MTGYQNFVKIFGKGIFISAKRIKRKFSLSKALSSLYILPTFFRGLYYIPTGREHRGHFIENKNDFFISLFNSVYGRNNWYWGLSSAARHYGIEWSATGILEIVALGKSKTINVSGKIKSLHGKSSYRSTTLVKYLSSLGVNTILIHKGKKDSFTSIKIDGNIGPVSSKEQIRKDIETYLPKVRHPNIAGIYRRILARL
jgi:hypothetical protein